MGTRNITMVIDRNGEKKIAQYGQWDGYPSGVGVGILEFLQDKDLFEKFKTNLPKVRFVDVEGRDKEFIDSYNANAPEWSNQPDNRTPEQKRWFSVYCHRDLADEVLVNIANSEDEEIILQDSENEGKKGGWCDYSWVINLKDNKLYAHYNLDEAAFIQFDLDNLPSKEEFLKQCDEAEAKQD